MSTPRAEESNPGRRRANWRALAAPVGAGLLVAGFFLLLVLRDPLLCWRDDYAISIMPVFADVARAWGHGEWPLLSPYSWACGNLAGEYQYGTFSPVVNLAVVLVEALPLSLPAKAAALSLSQLILLAIGAALLARRRCLVAGGGVLVAVVAALGGWNVEWGATDWFGALAANAWLPWCWWAFEEALEPVDAVAETPLGRWRRRILMPGVCVFLLLTGGFPYTVGMLGLLTVWLAVRAWVAGGDQSIGARTLALWPLAAGWLLGLGLAAPAWLSLLEYVPGSDRAHGVNVVRNAWNVPWTAWPALLLPSWSVGWPDFAGKPVLRYGVELAGGLVPVALLAAGFARSGARRFLRESGWELGLLAAVFLLCMLPSPGLFRWSFRWLPLFALVLAITAVRSCEGPDFAGKRVRRLAGNPGAWAVLLVALVWAVASARREAWATPVLLGAGTLLLAVAWAAGERLLPVAGRFQAWLPGLVALVSLWLCYTALPTNPGVPVYAIGENILAVAPLSPDRLYLSFYLEPYLRYRAWQTWPNFGAVVRPGSTSMFAGVHLINGYSPIMSAAIGRQLNMETHGCILPVEIGTSLLSGASDELGFGLLERLGVDGLIIAFDYAAKATPPAAQWEQVYQSNEGTVYHRRGGPLPAVFPIRMGGYRPVSVSRVVETRQSVSADVAVPADGPPAWIDFRRPYFPGYRATLDGRPLTVGSFANFSPEVELPPGSHGRLSLDYRPRAVWLGGVSAAICLSILGATAFATRLNRAKSMGRGSVR